jgi:hypothetical protein
MIIRVILDTCTVRNHLHQGERLLDFEAIRSSSEQLRFSLAGGTLAELLEQLVEARISFGDWNARVSNIDGILDQRWPVLPTGRELAALAGTQTDLSTNLESKRRHLKTCWQLTRNSHCLADLQTLRTYEGEGGATYGVTLDAKRPGSVNTGRRISWMEYIEKMQDMLPPYNIRYNGECEKKVLALMKQGLGTQPGDPPDLAQMLDPVARMIARLVCESLNPKTPYNPRTEDRKGDAFDISLLFYISLPTVICTADKKFVNRLAATKAPNAQQVMTVEDFNTSVAAGTLAEAISPFRTADEQGRRWQEEAYFHWQGRGRPGDDDWTDWFATEPLA